MWRRSPAIGRYGGLAVQVENLRDGMKESFRILLTCYQVLKANDDRRADEILTDAYNLLQERPANISDEETEPVLVFSSIDLMRMSQWKWLLKRP